MPELALRMTEMYCWAIEVGMAAVIQVRPRSRDNRMVLRRVERIFSFELIFLNVGYDELIVIVS